MSLLVKPLLRPGKALNPVPANPERRDNHWLKEQVAEAKADHDVNLLQPRRAYFHMREVLRHRNRFVDAVGGLSGAALQGKTILWMLLLAGGVTTAMVVNPWTPYWVDALVAVMMAMAIWTERMIAGAYREAFFKVYVVERLDFTDASQATAIQTVWLPRLGFYFRPEVWHGSDGHSGYLDAQAVVILQVPEDQSIDDSCTKPTTGTCPPTSTGWTTPAAAPWWPGPVTCSRTAQSSTPWACPRSATSMTSGPGWPAESST